MSLGSLKWLTYAYVILCQDVIAPGEFYHHSGGVCVVCCCVVDFYYSYIGKSTRWEYFVPTRTFIVVNSLSCYRKKCFTDTGCVCTSSVASKRAAIKQLAKNLWQEKLPHLFAMYTSAPYLLMLHTFLFHLLGEQASMHPNEADWIKIGGCYGKTRLKKVLHMLPCINNWQRICPCVIMCITRLWKTNGLLTINLLGRMCSCALHSEGKIILIIVTFIELWVYFNTYYNMTLGNNSLGLVMVLFLS